MEKPRLTAVSVAFLSGKAVRLLLDLPFFERTAAGVLARTDGQAVYKRE
ncbi:hypothetical protein [Geobacillus vulcani]|nr:hypothetical protein [Geobacillus vulcani]